ncbi:MAG: T9SS type A sorting domain-containing protein, partial [Bacteroidota bacterium]|nr:T9SS type A sorting domain-containing protein [Bacteroidota bacterium]
PDTHLNFTDASLLGGENIYRLKITLLNGTVIYSYVETVYHLAESPVYVYPNPARKAEVIKVITNESGRYTVQFFNSTGIEMYRQFLTASVTNISSSRLAAGLYFVRVVDKDGNYFVQKLIIQ